jgi:hypothetical protein
MSENQFSAFAPEKVTQKGRGRKSGGERAKRVLKKGSKDAAYFALLKREKGEKTIEELAELLSMDAKTMRTTVSRVIGTLRDMGASDENIAAILPSGYGEGRRGMRRAEALTIDDVNTMFDADDDTLDDLFADILPTENDDDTNE